MIFKLLITLIFDFLLTIFIKKQYNKLYKYYVRIQPMEENIINNQTKRCRVKFIVSTPHPVRRLYICGSTKNLGNWNAVSAKELRKKDGHFECQKYFHIGEEVSFKILEKMNWERVELGYWYEDIDNHTLIAEKGLIVEINVPNFRYDE